MTHRDDDPSDRPVTRANTVLRQIADALGSPVETFFTPSRPDGDAVSSEELLRLWAELPDVQAQRRVLSQLRFEVERHRLQSEAAE